VLKQLVPVEPQERQPLTWSWLYLFSVFFAYYVIRPIRDEVGVASGVNNLRGSPRSCDAGDQPAFAALVARAARQIHQHHLSVLHAEPARLPRALQSTTGKRPPVGRVLHLDVGLQSVLCPFWQFMVDVFSANKAAALGFWRAPPPSAAFSIGVTATTADGWYSPPTVSIALLKSACSREAPERDRRSSA
jgi:AAA family ATP:ADP antiporter